MAISSFKSYDIQVNVKGLGPYIIPKESTTGDLVGLLKDRVSHQVAAVIIDNRLEDLNFVLDKDCDIELIDTSSESGARIYRRSIVFMLIKACRELFPHSELIVKHSLSNGLYCELQDQPLSDRDIEQIQKRMREYVVQDLPIEKRVVSREEARRIYARQCQLDKVGLLEYRDKATVHIYELDGYYEYFYGYMLPRTSDLERFRLLNYPPGMILQTPDVYNPDGIRPFSDLPKLFNIYQEAKKWAVMLGTPHVAAFNDIIREGGLRDLIMINEALHEKKIADIADQICSNPEIRLVTIAGPSSSGKTTFANRLMIQLRVNGRRPVSISMDNYFVDRDLTPRDENGEYDFEALEALQLDLFNEHLCRLIDGEEVEIPRYDFLTGRSLSRASRLQVPPGELIIIEGIHGLNEGLTFSVPPRQKFRIYVSALTQLNIDYSNRIPTTDSRLIRRIVRDNRVRGYSALETLGRWRSVRRGEERNIFPFQENADVMFNSSLVYELAILKPYIEPLLAEIKPDMREYVEATTLLKFLSYFRPAPDNFVPPNSILREFIGGSWFKD
jgi:uridine kinase